MTEPEPPDPQWPRYSTRPFPSYRFVPRRTPHPRRDPSGHSYSLPEPKPIPFSVDRWHTSEDYLYGIDLYNFAYWWECHEVFEGLWHAVGHHSEQGNFFQALIQLAAANLKYLSVVRLQLTTSFAVESFDCRMFLLHIWASMSLASQKHYRRTSLIPNRMLRSSA